MIAFGKFVWVICDCLIDITGANRIKTRNITVEENAESTDFDNQGLDRFDRDWVHT